MKNYIIIVACCLIALTAKGQAVRKEADKQFELYNFTKAVTLYMEAYKRNPTTYITERLAESYRKTFNYAAAEKWYSRADSMPDAATKTTLAYGLMLQANGKYDLAKSAFRRYQIKGDSSVNDQQIERLISSCDSAKAWTASPVNVKIENQARLNSQKADWGPVAYKNGLVFTSDRSWPQSPGSSVQKHRPFLRFDGRLIKPDDKIYLWTGNNYNHLYFSAGDSLSIFPIDPGTNYHLGTATFNQAGNEMFFTLTRIPESIKPYEKISTINVEIYSSRLNSLGVWEKPVPLPINNVGSYSVSDPFLTGDTLYFSSNMPGGKGGTDLYYIVRNADNAWGQVQNIATLNTPGNERSPVMASNGDFYFASDGYIGMGGLDIFKVSNLNSTPNIINFKYPVNTSRDDFAISLSNVPGSYLFSSNREGGNGADDIYSLFIPRPIDENVILTGVVYDQETKIPIAGAKVTLELINGKSQDLLTDAKGFYQFKVAKNSSYKLTGSKPNYIQAIEQVKTDTARRYIQDLYLHFFTDQAIVLPNIHYDFDKHNIRPDAAVQLDKVLVLLNKYPNLKLELSSHTDSRGSDVYNQWLSQKRAESAVAYLVGKGIARDRITAHGYGETRLLNRCANGVACSKEEHQANRRTEIKKAN
ncbi:outer membrane protein OmpA-like peptidoglycan-associated protein/tetratricopeptide (TPR) repeat protein [Pedobacter sp. AK017]|uniref:OmpA family protein n=1 Tax=Pedobacter sp. AK017 TaxID=2723073 RepID=UPI001609E55C|nr:OmpA family protein [Pedobacter sp. AK017]MBB5441004.1 outer membrane protein OmpA-like peptidoglycan-associated protein/tetratricopeptide (TPR) repeat protein [Pedobacter sp. AK017]